MIIYANHPVMAGHEAEVMNTLQNPEEIRRSKVDSSVYLFYKAQRQGRWVCAVSKHRGDKGFLITILLSKVWPVFCR